jgi:hypothetical protein
MGQSSESIIKPFQNPVWSEIYARNLIVTSMYAAEEAIAEVKIYGITFGKMIRHGPRSQSEK